LTITFANVGLSFDTAQSASASRGSSSSPIVSGLPPSVRGVMTLFVTGWRTSPRAALNTTSSPPLIGGEIPVPLRPTRAKNAARL
jgi:hypothetical protein